MLTTVGNAIEDVIKRYIRDGQKSLGEESERDAF